ncbi:MULTISPECIES: hypothetical protein [Edwardsiella]|uniref:Suppressor protein n=2 Tax=Edwardsiella anguillarum TaxID=1821960 RepID=A0ABY8SDV8_9GAMM|nr:MULTISPECIES: hypothetical protein [Edwardsiella]AIJ06926.1 Suppression of copper sensitivity: putative copper binding protein ScsA [Edwardsiella anguillarum ET080813]AKR78358.2 suppressor protein [Edwardsiella sp. LADL05-105]KAB0593511.1 suppressor protein [Edwardsiella anguillarum]UOU78082.1 suppressor protein [Edwardsiella anguillarum]WHP79294.1 suppressor protein [Edwardsiella anguillarum]
MQHSRAAKFFLALVCLLVAVCTAQRIAGLQPLGAPPSLSAQSMAAPGAEDNDAPSAHCALRAKMLLSAPPLEHLGAVPWAFLALLLCPLCPPARFFTAPPPALSPPQRRLHLRLCIFHE